MSAENDLLNNELEEEVAIMANRARARARQVGKLVDQVTALEERIKELEEKYEPEERKKRLEAAEGKAPATEEPKPEEPKADGGTDATVLPMKPDNDTKPKGKKRVRA